MDPNAYKTIEEMVKAFEVASEIIRKENPDCIIAPMFGAVPFIDILNIIDDEFPNQKVEYIPASSKVHRLREVLRGSFINLIEAYAKHGGKFLSLDEVVSGNSLVRVFKQFDAARRSYANSETVQVYGENTDFRKEEIRAYRDQLLADIQYRTIGIIDPKMERTKKKQNPEYLHLIEQGIVLPVQTKGIVTMDRTAFFPARYRRETDQEGTEVTLPIVDTFSVSSEYIHFFKQVAEIVGKDPTTITVYNMGKISNAHQWVPKELQQP